MAGVVSGAFVLSSNRRSPPGGSINLGGQGWITGPDGEVLGFTTPERPFLTVELDLAQAERARRYVRE